MYIYTHTHNYIYIYMYIYTYIYMCIYTYVHMYIFTYVYMYISICIYVYIYMYMYIYVHTCIYIYIYLGLLNIFTDTWLTVSVYCRVFTRSCVFSFSECCHRSRTSLILSACCRGSLIRSCAAAVAMSTPWLSPTSALLCRMTRGMCVDGVWANLYTPPPLPFRARCEHHHEVYVTGTIQTWNNYLKDLRTQSPPICSVWLFAFLVVWFVGWN